jgi:LytS/YehU family sensor histidine kinase
MLALTSYILQVDPATINRIALFSMIPFVGAFAFIIFIFYRRHREEKLKKERLLLELTALRAQMNPHFIFNCLNAIYNSIMAHRNEEAASYLLKFTFLTRRILENSHSKWIDIADDLEMLQTYCELEKIRFTAPLHIEFGLETSEDTSDVQVPMLLIQPLIENIIWHGLSQVINGYIIVHIKVSQHSIHYQIRTNGTQSTAHNAPPKPGKTKSMGRALVVHQLNAIGKLTHANPTFKEWTSTELGYPEYQTLISIPHVSIPRTA